MLVVYLFLLLALAFVHGLVRLRVRRLERRFSAVAAEADALLKKSSYRSGNSRPDPYQSAKQQFELARLALKRDRIEDRPGDYRERVVRGYREAAIGTGRRSALSLCYRAPVVLIDASADRDVVFERIKSEVGRVLALDPRP